MVGFVLAIEQNHGFTCVIAWASGYARYHWQQIQMQIHSKHSAIFSAKENTQASEISLCLLESKLPPILISCKRVTDKLTSVDKVSDKSSLENFFLEKASLHQWNAAHWPIPLKRQSVSLLQQRGVSNGSSCSKSDHVAVWVCVFQQQNQQSPTEAKQKSTSTLRSQRCKTSSFSGQW